MFEAENKKIVMPDYEMLIAAIKSSHTNIQIQPNTKIKERAFIDDFPHEGVRVDIKPDMWGIYVFYFSKFKFFDFIKVEEYFKSELKYKNVNFLWTNGSMLWVYPNSKMIDNIDFCIDLFNYTQKIVQGLFDDVQKYVKTDKIY